MSSPAADPTVERARVDLSVVLCTYNGGARIGAQLDALRAQRWDRAWEVVVVDNRSDDDTVDVVHRATAADRRFRVVSAPERAGLAYARNVGAGAAAGRNLAFVDDDDVVADGWVAAIGDALDRHELVGSALDYERLNSCDVRTGRADFQSDRIERLMSLPSLAGAGFGVRAATWRSLGGNDEQWEATGEDFEFSFRAAVVAGIEPVLVPGAVYHYLLRCDTKGTFRQARRYGASHARLYRAWGRPAGAAPEPLNVVLRQWLWVARHVADLLAPARATRWARIAGKRLGRLQGSVIYRTWYP